MLVAEREKHLRIVAGISADTPVDLSLIKLPNEALMFPNLGNELSFVDPRRPREVTKAFAAKARKLGFPIRLHDLRGTHETLLLDAGIPAKAVSDRCGHDVVACSETTRSELARPIPARHPSLATSRKESLATKSNFVSNIVSRTRFVLEVRLSKCLKMLRRKGGRVV